MAGMDPSVATTTNYPKILTNKDWQKQKGKLAKLHKTGLGDALDKLEALIAKVDIQKLDPASQSGTFKTARDIDDAVDTARDHYRKTVQPAIDQAKAVVKAADAAEKQLKKAAGGGDAAKAAAAVSKAADTFAVTLKSIDLDARVQTARDDLQRKIDTARKLLKQAIAKMAGGIKAFNGAPSFDAWTAVVKQPGRSVSNSLAYIPETQGTLWKDWQSTFKGFDESSLGLAASDPEVVTKMQGLLRQAGTQLKQINAAAG